MDTGTINIEERSNTVSWYGNVEEPVWIVSSWYDEKGDAHGDDLPVPGMNHQAITTEEAEACIRTATRAWTRAAAARMSDGATCPT